MKSAEEASSRPTSPLARPVVHALLDAQPIPAFLITPEGVIPNAAAEVFVTATDAGAKVLVSDGTDLWTILAGRSDEASPFFDVRTRLRSSDTASAEATLSVVPVRGPGGSIAAAMVFVLAVPNQRFANVTATAGDDMQALVERVGRPLGACQVALLEYEDETASRVMTRAHWSSDGTEPPPASFPLDGTPGMELRGKRLLVIPSGLGEDYPNAPGVAGLEAHVGVVLTNRHGERIGWLGASWREPLIDVAGASAVLAMAGVDASRALADDIAKRELRESEQRYGALFEGSVTPMLVVEPSTTQVVDANPAACEFYGFPRDEFLTMSILQVEALSMEDVQAEIRRAAEGRRGHFVGQHLLSGGRLRDVEMTIGPITVAGRRLLYCMINDVTERRRAEAELERRKRSLELAVGQRTEDLLRANTELQQASMTRDLVVANLAQELRTSLQTIIGFSQLLLGEMAGELSEEQRRQVQMVQEAGERLSEFAAALAASKQAQERPGTAEAEDFDVVGLVESVLTGLGLFAQDKGLQLHFKADHRPVPVCADRYKVQQILLNLLSNGIRYTDRGSITAAVAQDEDGSVVISVSDTGAGLAPETIKGLFEEPGSAFPKAGIGLPSSQRIARELGGSIEVLSVEGNGSTFTLRLPPRNGELCDE